MAITKLVISGADSKTISLAHKAQSTSVVPDDNITATNVQDALEQLDDIKAQATNGTLTNPTISGSASFGDNVKANFGASDDLQIYSDGTHSRIHESGSGLLVVRASNFNVNTADGSESYITMEDGGGVASFYNGEQMLSTTFTGIDVTGTATMDGLTVQDIGNTSAKFERSSTQFIEISGSASGQAILSNANDAVNKSLIVGTVDSNAFALRTDDANRVLIDSNGDISFYEDTGTTPKLFWDASAEQLIAKEGALLKVTETDSSTVAAQLASDSDEGLLQLYHGGSEKVRLRTNADSYLNGGNVLVGKTASNFSVEGAEFRSSPTTFQSTATFTRDGFNAVAFNRLTNDGSIVDFSKDGTTVGSIGTKHGDIYLGTGDTGLRFYDDGNAVYPAQASDGAGRDAAVDLGSTSKRFKDLYLSGGVHLGGTGDANKLDDYEEGTWTPAASGYDGTMTVNSAAYTKIGRLVHLRASVTFSDTADGSIIQITGLPFAQGTANTGRGGSVTRDTSGSVAFTDGSASTVLRMLSNTHSTVTYTAVRGATVEFFHIYDA